MANEATTLYKIKGSRKAVNSIYNTLVKMDVNMTSVCLWDLAEYFNIDVETKNCSVRGRITWAEYDKEKNILSLYTETAWDACTNFFNEINHKFGDELSISYRVCESGNEIFYAHDEDNFFPEKFVVICGGDMFEDYDEEYKFYHSLKDIIDEWCEIMDDEQGVLTDKEMMDYINNYEYDDDSYYFIHNISFE